MNINIPKDIKNEQIFNVACGAAVGAQIGEAAGEILKGVVIAIPGGPEVVIVKKAVAVTLPKVMKVSGAAVGTVLGAAWGIGINIADAMK